MCWILISQFSYVENSLHFNLADFRVDFIKRFFQCGDGQLKKLHVFNVTILLKLRKFDVRKIYVFYNTEWGRFWNSKVFLTISLHVARGAVRSVHYRCIKKKHVKYMAVFTVILKLIHLCVPIFSRHTVEGHQEHTEDYQVNEDGVCSQVCQSWSWSSSCEALRNWSSRLSTRNYDLLNLTDSTLYKQLLF